MEWMWRKISYEVFTQEMWPLHSPAREWIVDGLEYCCLCQVQIYAHVKDSISICRKRVGMVMVWKRKNTARRNKSKIKWVALYYGCSLSPWKDCPDMTFTVDWVLKTNHLSIPLVCLSRPDMTSAVDWALKASYLSWKAARISRALHWDKKVI